MHAQADHEAALRQIAISHGLDALVLMSPENFAFGTGLHIFTIEKIRPRQAFMIVPADGAVELVLCSIEVPLSRTTGVYQNIQSYVEFEEQPINRLCARLKALGLSKGRVGIDADYMPLATYERLRSLLGELSVSDTSPAVAQLRAIKTPAQVSILEQAARHTHRAVLDAMSSSQLGDAEEAMCLKISKGIMERGADGISFLVFASGERTLVPHAKATGRVPEESEIIRLDVGGTYGSYSSDFARTYSTGSPTAFQKQTYNSLVQIQKAVITQMKPGVVAEDIYFLARDEYRNRDMDFRMAHVGHGFGVELHEAPMLRPGDKTPLAAGMVLNVEPVATDGHGARYHVEDLVEITAEGPRLLTLGFAPEEIPVLGQPLAYPL